MAHKAQCGRQMWHMAHPWRQGHREFFCDGITDLQEIIPADITLGMKIRATNRSKDVIVEGVVGNVVDGIIKIGTGHSHILLTRAGWKFYRVYTGEVD